ncbi:MAG: DUF1385 domain-containing protein [Chloroflexi bacterium]|nr:MAG: DUF1385 domain-containing protein [Phototrophicales bacterium]RMF81039.1 MAG: DUF1385 domain-containing protein [Chloroflexota bacterium]
MSENANGTPPQFSYGGQAVIEGVMMRGAHNAAIAVRNPEGQIVVHEQALNATLYRGRISKLPFVRGLILLWDALGLGTRALMWSADVALGEEEDVSFDGPIGYVTIAFSFILGIGLFFLLPAAASSGAEGLLDTELPGVVENILEGLIRLGLLIAYIWAIGHLPDVKRLFGYHGAEHKTINAYEAGAELTPEEVIKYPIEHPRCGTAFLLTVAVISVILFATLGRPSLPLLLLSRVILIPVVAGISYEYIRFTAKHINNPVIRVIIKPNLALQSLTTNQPDLGMCEVAIVSFKRVLASEGIISDEEATIPEPNPEAAAPRPEPTPVGD